MYKLESGQIFREWTVPAPPLRPASLDWSTTRPSGCRGPRRRRGQRSLVEMAIETVAENAAGLSKKHLEPLPIQLVRRIWRFLEARGVCLHAWKTFSPLLLEKANDDNDDDGLTLGLYRFRQHICRPDGELWLYTRPLSSTAADFVTHLTMSGGSPFSATELLPLAEMRNLAVLELIRPVEPRRWQGEAEEGVAFPQVTDRLIRGWAEARDPFPVLGILRIWGCEAVTEVSLRWAGRLPALVLYDVVPAVGGEGGAYCDGWRSVREEGAASAGWQVVRGADLSVYRSLATALRGPSSDGGQDVTGEDLYRGVDADLVSSLCCDSRRRIGFAKQGMRAPPLLKSLMDLAVTAPSGRCSRTMTDAVRSGSGTGRCHGIPFEASSFWLYALMGQLSGGGDDDNLGSGRQAVMAAAAGGSLVLPPKPMACLCLGHGGQDGILSEAAYLGHGGRRRTRRFMFIRPGILRGEVPKTKGSEGENGGAVRQPLMRRKKRRLEDVLGMFS